MKKYQTKDGKILLMIYFEGKVQGVCFRYTSNMKAVIHKLSGYCKNTNDNEVECLLKGYIDDIESVIFALQEEFEIRSMRCERLETDLWESDELHYIVDSGNRISRYDPNPPKINYAGFGSYKADADDNLTLDQLREKYGYGRNDDYYD
jgi:acylphosphatase